MPLLSKSGSRAIAQAVPVNGCLKLRPHRGPIECFAASAERPDDTADALMHSTSCEWHVLAWWLHVRGSMAEYSKSHETLNAPAGWHTHATAMPLKWLPLQMLNTNDECTAHLEPACVQITKSPDHRAGPRVLQLQSSRECQAQRDE